MMVSFVVVAIRNPSFPLTVVRLRGTAGVRYERLIQPPTMHKETQLPRPSQPANGQPEALSECKSTSHEQQLLSCIGFIMPRVIKRVRLNFVFGDSSDIAESSRKRGRRHDCRHVRSLPDAERLEAIEKAPVVFSSAKRSTSGSLKRIR